MQLSYVEQLGRVCWKEFHIFVHWQPLSTQDFHQFLQTIANDYPCVMCRQHFADILKRKQAGVLEQSPSMCLFHLHNLVNKSRKKKEYSTEILEQYQTKEARDYFNRCLKIPLGKGNIDLYWKERLHHNHIMCKPFQLSLSSIGV